MNIINLVFTGLGIAILIGNLYVTFKCLKSDYSDATQKKLQLLLVWIVPLVGALTVLHFSVRQFDTPNFKTSDADPANPEKIGFGYVPGSGDSSGGSDQ